MRIRDWSSDVCSSDLKLKVANAPKFLDCDLLDADHGASGKSAARTAGSANTPSSSTIFLRFAAMSARSLVVARASKNVARTAPATVPTFSSAPVLSPVVLLFCIFPRSEEHTSELQSLMRISYAVFCLKKKKNSLIQDYKYIT